MRDLLQGVVDMVESVDLVHIDEETEADSGQFVEQEDWTQQDEDRFNGEEAGTVFAQRHILDKINLFLEEYRRNNYSEDFVEGFIEGINGVTGGNITVNDEDAVKQEVDSTN